MEKDSNKNEIGFFERLKIAIFKLENYNLLVIEKPGKSFKYLLLLVLLTTILVTAAVLYNFSKVVNKIYDYMLNEFPEFTYSDYKLDAKGYTEGYDEEFDFRIIVDTQDISKEKMAEYKQKLKKSSHGLIVQKDNALYVIGNNEIKWSYKEICEPQNITYDTKTLKENLGPSIKNIVYITFFMTFGISLYFADIIKILADVCFAGIFAWFVAKLFGLRMPMIRAIALAIYSLSLSIILQAINMIILILFGLNIAYFDIIYTLIYSIYVIATVLIIRDDLIKEKEEIEKLRNSNIIENEEPNKIEEQVKEDSKNEEKEIKKEIENKEVENKEVENKETKKEVKNTKAETEETENNEENKKTNEPDGSEI